MARDGQLERVRRFASWLDSGIAVPGTRLRIGLDPILGLVPGFGDAAGAVLSAWLLIAGMRRGVSRGTLLRMALNIAVDALVGAVPILGDLFDFAWKANLRNVALIERDLTAPILARKKNRVAAWLLGSTLLLLLAALLVGSAALAIRSVEALFAH